MTDSENGPGTSAPNAVVDEWAQVEGAKKHYSKDYWDIVFYQLSRNRLFKVGVAILAILYGIAIYAPFIANDRPYVLAGVDKQEYDGALRLLSPVAGSIRRFVGQTPEEYVASRSDQAPATLADAIEVERSAARDRLAILRSYLPDAAEPPVDAFEAQIEAAVAAFEAGDSEAAVEAAGQARSLARDMRTELQPKLPALDEESEGDGAGSEAPAAEPVGVELEPKKLYPLWTNISKFESWMMVFWALVMLWPLWNPLVNKLLLGGDRESIRRWRRRKLFVCLALPTVVAIAWTFATGGARDTFDASPIKSRLTSGEFVPTVEPVLPPLFYGYSETHQTENYRPPTWSFKGKRDEEGKPLDWRPDRTGVEATYSPVEVRYAEPDVNAPTRHVAGTDHLGRDFLVRMIWGGRISLSVGILSSVLLTCIGIVIGSLAGYFGGWIDIVIMRFIEVIQSIPAFFLILATMSFTDPEVISPIFAIIIVIALIRWTGVARLVRGEFLRLREQEFVVASQALGFSSLRTIFKHVLPNALSPVLVTAAFAVASGILTESAVSFLGFGIQEPKASWGSLVNVSRDPSHWWVQVFPGLLIFVTVTCYNLVGDAVRDALDPKMKV